MSRGSKQKKNAGGENLQAILFLHHGLSLFDLAAAFNSPINEGAPFPPLYAGLSWNAATCFQIVLFPCGVTGALTVIDSGFTCIAGVVLGGVTCCSLILCVAELLLNRRECCGSWWIVSSGSTSSRSLSAALSACSARARMASSTRGWPALAGGEDMPSLEPVERGELELFRERVRDCGERGAGG